MQRVSTMLSFFGVLKSEDEGINKKNGWKLEEGDRVEALEGFSYEALPELFKRSLKRATCRVEILNWNSKYDMRFELFNRLNTGGSPLTAQEIRNCIYRDISSKFNDFLAHIANDKNFKTLIALDDEQIERLYHEELALRFISLYQNDIKHIKGSISQHMTTFMKDALENSNFDYAGYEKLFADVFALLNKPPLNQSIFRQKDGKFATSLYDVITIGISENYDTYKNAQPETILKKINDEVRTDAVLLKFSRRGGNNQVSRIVNRLKEAQRIFGKQ